MSTALVPGSNFELLCRVARINLTAAAGEAHEDSRLAILADGTRLPLSRAGYARLKAPLDERK